MLLKVRLALIAPLALKASQAAIEWGDPSCWSGWRVHELCCYPNAKVKRDGTTEELGFQPCWDETRNVSRCCRPRGSFFRVSGDLSARAEAFLEGCQAPAWQNFLFKVRMTAGNLWMVDSRETKWFQYFGLRMARRRSTGACAAGMAIHRVLWDYLSVDVSEESITALNVLASLDVELRRWGGLFPAFGMTLEQLRFIRSLQLLQNLYTNRPVRRKFKYQPFNNRVAGASPMAFDFGASGGLDTEFYLSSGFKVVAIEGNIAALQKLRSRLVRFENRQNLTLVHAVAGASSAPPTAEFKVDHHQPEISGLFDKKPFKDGNVEIVPRRACGALYSHFLRRSRRNRPEYVKIDLEGLDVPCLVSLLRNSTAPHEGPDGMLRPWATGRRQKSVANSSTMARPPSPNFLSIEVHLRHPVHILEETAIERARMLRNLLRGRYCAAKLCRQHIYNIRHVEGFGTLSRSGLGSSGLFGNAAVDWRAGEEWRPLETVLTELPLAGWLSVLAMEWFDLHLRRC